MPNRSLLCAVVVALVAPACAKSGTTPPVGAPEPAVVYQPTESQLPGEPAPALATPTGDEAMAFPSPGVADAVSTPPGGEVAAIPAPETAGMSERPGLTDAQILKVTQTVNSGEIEQAKLARSKAKSEPVRNFATHMLGQHSQANQQGSSLAKQEQLVLEDSATAAQLSAEGGATLEKLKATEQIDFDRTYVDAQVEQHAAVLEMLTSQLIPNASDERLKAQLLRARAMVEQHLSDARALQARLNSAPPSTGH